jgi:hypothetical protein
MAIEEKDHFITDYKKILVGSKTLYQKEFTYSGHTYGEIFELAAGIRKTLTRRGRKSASACARKTRRLSPLPFWPRSPAPAS